MKTDKPRKITALLPILLISLTLQTYAIPQNMPSESDGAGQYAYYLPDADIRWIISGGINGQQYPDHVRVKRRSNLSIRVDETNGSLSTQLSSRGDAVIPDFQVNGNAGGTDHDKPSIAIAGNGTFIISWEDLRSGQDVYGRIFNADGTARTGDFRISESGKYGALQTRAAAASASNFFVAWDNRAQGSGDRYDVYGQIISGDGQLIGNNIKVNDSEPSGSYPSVHAAGNSGTFVAVWSERNADWTSRGIYYQLYDTLGNELGDNGQLIGAGERIDDADVRLSESGNMLIGYRDGVDMVMRTFNSVGEMIYQTISFTAGQSFYVTPRVAWAGTENRFLIWTDYRSDSLYLGTVIDQAITSTVVNDGSSNIYPLSLWTSAIATTSSGNGVITWKGTNEAIYTRSISSGGILGNQINTLVDSTHNYAILDMDFSNDFGVVTWRETWNLTKNIFAIIIDTTGLPIGPSFRVNADSANAHHSAPTITVNSAGKAVIGWLDRRYGGFSVFAQQFDNMLSPLRSNIRVSTDYYNWGQNVGLQSNDDFVVTIEENHPSIWNSYIKMRPIGANGQFLGPVSRVNGGYGDNYAGSPYISVLPDDSYFIVWHDGWGFNQQGGYNILGRLYSKEYQPLTELFIINDDTSSAGQYSPKIANNAGMVAVVWEDERNGQWQIWGQMLTKSGLMYGDNFIISSDTISTDSYNPSLSFNDSTLMVTWTGQVKHSLFPLENDYIIMGRYFNSKGQPLSGPFRISPETPFFGFRDSDISVDVNGQVAVVWDEPATAGWDIYAQRFSSDLAALGGTFIVNSNQNAANEIYPSVVLHNGIIYTTWMSNNAPFENYNIWANGISFTNPPANNGEPTLPDVFALYQNHPNPFNGATTIHFNLQEASIASLIIYDLLGREVAQLANGYLSSGAHRMFWKGLSSSGRAMPSGVYIARLATPEYTKSIKMVMLK